MPLNPFLLAAAKQTTQKVAFVQPGGAAAADPTAPQQPQPGAAPGSPPGAPTAGAPGAAPPAPPAAGGDPSAAGGDPAAGPPMAGGFDLSQLPTMIQQAVQQAMAGGGAGGGAKKGGGGGKEDAVAKQLYTHNRLLTAMANAQGIQLPNEDILGPPPGADLSSSIGTNMAGQDPNAAAQGQDPNAQAQGQPQPTPQPQPMNFAQSLVQKTAADIVADRIGSPRQQLDLVPLQVEIPVLDVIRMQAMEAAQSGQPKLASTSSAAAALHELLGLMKK